MFQNYWNSTSQMVNFRGYFCSHNPGFSLHGRLRSWCLAACSATGCRDAISHAWWDCPSASFPCKASCLPPAARPRPELRRDWNFLSNKSSWGWSPWSSGNWRKLMIDMAWVQTSALTEKVFTFICMKIQLSFEKDKNKCLSLLRSEKVVFVG